MTEPRPRPRRLARLLHRKLVLAVVSVPLAIAGVCNWLTADLEPPLSEISTPPRHKVAPDPPRQGLAEWPTSPLRGRAGAILALDSLLDAQARLDSAGGYTAVMYKTERINGKLGDEQVLEMKCRVSPFAVYFKFRTPEPGKEVVFCEGRYDNQVIAHGTGLSRRLIPRIKVDPNSSIAMVGNRHPITEAGVRKLTAKLIGFRRMDLEDPHAESVLDRVTDASGREWLRSVHSHPHRKSERPFQLVEVLYHPETRIPYQIRNFDWLEPGETGEPRLAETYRYEELNLDAGLTDLDFDPANPAYGFSSRF